MRWLTVLLPVVLCANSDAEPPFEIPNEYDCHGENFAGDRVSAHVMVEGDRDSLHFQIDFETSAAWPNGQAVIPDLRATYFDGPSYDQPERLWYWTGGTFGPKILIDGEESGFGFDVNVEGTEAGLRFSRNAVGNMSAENFEPDPLSGRNVTCTPVAIAKRASL